MGRAVFEDLSAAPEWKAEIETAPVPDLDELLEGLSARESVWVKRLAEIRAQAERQAAVFAAREAAQAAREKSLISRLEQRGRVIDELTTFLGELTSVRQEEAHVLEETQRALRIAERRLAKTRSAARVVAIRQLKSAGTATDPELSAID